MQETKELLEQEWVVTEDGKSILEDIYEQMKVMKEMLDALDEGLRRLDERMTLQQEVADLRKQLDEVKEERSRPTIDPGYTVHPPAPTCTPGRAGVWTNGTYGGNEFYTDGTMWTSASASTNE